MTAMPEKSTAETNCQTLGRRGEEGHSQALPVTPGPRRLPSPARMPRNGWFEGKEQDRGSRA